MKENPLLILVLCVFVVSHLVGFRIHQDDRSLLEHANHRIVELTQDAAVRNRRIDALGNEVISQRTRAESCQVRERLRGDREAVRRMRISAIPSRWFEP